MAQYFPITRAILYKNGMAYFERKGVVKGESTVELSFPVSEMNDILKSVNVIPANKNTPISSTTSITFEIPPAGKTENSKQLRNITNSSQTQLLRGLCGENVSVVVKVANGTEVVHGMLLAVENASHSSVSERISVLVDGNSIKIYNTADVESIGMTNHNVIDNTKSLKIHLKSPDTQELLITYIREWPIWKPTYRAVMLSGGQAMLYGWATVHNPGTENWSGVSVSLVSGQPVSFVQELYLPKYGKRPKMTRNSSSLGISSLLVQQSNYYESDDDNELLNKLEKRDRSRKRGFSPPRRRQLSRSRERSMSRSRSRSRSRSPPRSRASVTENANSAAGKKEASESADLFRYDLAAKLDLPSSTSALAPIVETAFPGKNIALYNRTLHDEHPFSTLWLVNNTDLTLEAGPLTLFENQMYIGEAFLQTTKPRERRFVPFAVEFSLVISKKGAVSETCPPHWAKIENGVLTFTNKKVLRHHYVIQNKSSKFIELILEHPKDHNEEGGVVIEKITNEKYADPIDVTTEYVTGLLYGFKFKVPPASTTNLHVTSQETLVTYETLENLSLYRFLEFTKKKWLDTNLETALTEFYNMLVNRSTTEKRKSELQKRRTDIANEQKRMTEIFKVVSDKSGVTRYIAKIEQAENDLDQIKKETEDLEVYSQQFTESFALLCNQIAYNGQIVQQQQQHPQQKQ